jgi:rhomboid family protein
VLMAAHSVGVGAGASGAICGILAAEAVWFVFNRRYLPRSILRQAWTSFIINFILLVFISSFKNVSGWAHFGGAAAGAIAALLLHLHRFGPPVWRWLALTGFVPLVWYGHFIIENARASESVWLKAEDEQFEKRWGRHLTDALEEAGDTYDEIQPVLQKHPTRRDAAQVEKALSLVVEQKQKLADLEKQLLSAPLYHGPHAMEAEARGCVALSAGSDLFKQAEHHLRVGEQRTDRDRETLRALELGLKETRRDWRRRETRP